MWCEGRGCGEREEGVVRGRRVWCEGGGCGVREEGVVRERRVWYEGGECGVREGVKEYVGEKDGGLRDEVEQRKRVKFQRLWVCSYTCTETLQLT